MIYEHIGIIMAEVRRVIQKGLLEMIYEQIRNTMAEVWSLVREMFYLASETTIYEHDYNDETVNLCEKATEGDYGCFFVKCRLGTRIVGYVCHRCIARWRWITTLGFAQKSCPTCGFERHDDNKHMNVETIIYDIKPLDRPGINNHHHDN